MSCPCCVFCVDFLYLPACLFSVSLSMLRRCLGLLCLCASSSLFSFDWFFVSLVFDLAVFAFSGFVFDILGIFGTFLPTPLSVFLGALCPVVFVVACQFRSLFFAAFGFAHLCCCQCVLLLFFDVLGDVFSYFSRWCHFVDFLCNLFALCFLSVKLSIDMTSLSHFCLFLFPFPFPFSFPFLYSFSLLLLVLCPGGVFCCFLFVLLVPLFLFLFLLVFVCFLFLFSCDVPIWYSLSCFCLSYLLLVLVVVPVVDVPG